MMVEFLKKKRLCVEFSACFMLFMGLMIYFIQAHPLVIFDADDWLYAGAMRHAIPQPGLWNPIKIFPEILTPFLTMIGVRVFMPFTGDLISAVSISYGLFVSALILCFFVLQYKYFREKFGIGTIKGIVVLFFLICFYFLLFASQYTGSVNMFTERDTTCVFNYTVPALLNSCLVLYFMKNGMPDFFDKSRSIIHRTVILGICYLAVFSSIQENMILAIFIGVDFFCGIFLLECNGYSIKEYCIKRMSSLCILTCWLLSLALEATGGRAEKSTYSISSVTVGGALKAFISRLTTLNIWCLLLGTGIAAAFIMCICFKRIEKDDLNAIFKDFVRNSICLILTFVYTALLCAKVEPSYMMRSGVIFGIVFWIVFTLGEVISLTMKDGGQWVIISGIVVIFFANELFNGDRRFIDSNVPGVESAQCAELSRDIINSIQEADSKKESSVNILVPVFSDTDNNFPLNDDAAVNVFNVLRRFRMVSDGLEVNFVPTEEMNLRYGMIREKS